MRKFSLPKAACIVLVFCAAPAISSPAQTLTTLYSFCSQGNCADGSEPLAGLVQGADGNFYGTTFRGAQSNDCSQLGSGTVFKITPHGTLTTLYSFGDEGFGSSAGLVQGTDGDFYGTTASSCAGQGGGMVFNITPSGALTILHDFDGRDASTPFAGLAQGTDGNFYGTTAGGGISNNSCDGCGTVFKITPSGTFNILYSFCSRSGCADGYEPFAGLVQGTDGNFYGTTVGGGVTNSCRQRGLRHGLQNHSHWTLTTLYSFCAQGGTQCTDGDFPYAELGAGHGRKLLRNDECWRAPIAPAAGVVARSSKSLQAAP